MRLKYEISKLKKKLKLIAFQTVCHKIRIAKSTLHPAAYIQPSSSIHIHSTHHTEGLSCTAHPTDIYIIYSREIHIRMPAISGRRKKIPYNINNTASNEIRSVRHFEFII